MSLLWSKCLFYSNSMVFLTLNLRNNVLIEYNFQTLPKFLNLIYIIRLKNLLIYYLSLYISEKTGSISHVTGSPNLLHKQEDRIHIAVNPDLIYVLHISRSFSLFPYLLPASAPEMRNSSLDSFLKSFPVHISAHKHFFADIILNNNPNQIVVIFQGL